MRKALVYTLAALASATMLAGEANANRAARAVPIFDTDNDGTVDLNEISKSAEEVFGRLEKDNDGTLDRKEIGGRVSKKDFAAADPDNDGTLSKDEFLAMIAGVFKDADGDNDGTLDEKELRSKKGRGLLRVAR
jgi:hypothetical protein